MSLYQLSAHFKKNLFRHEVLLLCACNLESNPSRFTLVTSQTWPHCFVQVKGWKPHPSQFFWKPEKEKSDRRTDERTGPKRSPADSGPWPKGHTPGIPHVCMGNENPFSCFPLSNVHLSIFMVCLSETGHCGVKIWKLSFCVSSQLFRKSTEAAKEDYTYTFFAPNGFVPPSR